LCSTTSLQDVTSQIIAVSICIAVKLPSLCVLCDDSTESNEIILSDK